MRKKRKILLRFDDFCPTMSWEQWEQAKNLMDKAGVVALLGIVPDCKDKDLLIEEPRNYFWTYVKGLQDKGFTIAMHGYQHIFEIKADGLVTKDKISEFAGLPYEVQLNKLLKGKELLRSHGIETNVFFAPAHSYDDNTLKALAASGFCYVSDGLSKKPYKRYGITLLPCRTGGIPRLRKNDDHITAVVHAHEWLSPNKLTEKQRFSQLINEHSFEIVSFEDFCKWPTSNSFLQRIFELLYLFKRNSLVPLFYQIKNHLNRFHK